MLVRSRSRWLWVLLGAGLACAPAHADSTREIVGTICLFCHGEAGDSQGAEFPKLAGQQSRYLRKQLGDFLTGNRQNELMASFLPFLKVDDFPGLGVYYADQKPSPWPASNAALVASGKKLYEDGNTDSGVPACAGCHQPNALGKDEFPRLAAQSQTYLLQQLAHFRNGVRTNDRGRLMQVLAARLSDDEMKALAEYLAGIQPGP